MVRNKQFYSAADIAKILDRSESYSYKIIRKLNAELKAQGYLTIRGRVPAAYFEDRYNSGGY